MPSLSRGLWLTRLRWWMLTPWGQVLGSNRFEAVSGSRKREAGPDYRVLRQDQVRRLERERARGKEENPSSNLNLARTAVRTSEWTVGAFAAHLRACLGPYEWTIKRRMMERSAFRRYLEG